MYSVFDTLRVRYFVEGVKYLLNNVRISFSICTKTSDAYRGSSSLPSLRTTTLWNLRVYGSQELMK